MISENDTRQRRCPMLGHDIAFSYCRHPGQDTPCRKIFDCWWEEFDVASFMQSHFSQEILHCLTNPPKPKTLSLFELIEQARQRASNNM